MFMSGCFSTLGCRLVLGKVVTTSKAMMDLIFDLSRQCVENNSFMVGNALFTEYRDDGGL